MPLPHPQLLQKLKVPIIHSDICSRLYWRGAGQETITEDMLCAGYLEGERDACLVSAHPCRPGQEGRVPAQGRSWRPCASSPIPLPRSPPQSLRSPSAWPGYAWTVQGDPRASSSSTEDGEV